MCGIIGVSNFYKGNEIVAKGLEILGNRGKDHSASEEIKDTKIIFGHNLHSVVDVVKQPLVSKNGMLVINCEIYNWKKLCAKYKINAKNDSMLVLKLIELKGLKKIVEVVEELDGDFAFAYYSKKEEKIVLAKDIAGVKPLVYSFNEKEKQFAFASEKKTFDFETTHLNPRQILTYNLKTNKLSIKKTGIQKAKKTNEIEIQKTLLASVSKRIPDKDFALLLSGGIDSALLGMILRKDNLKFNSYFAGIKDLEEPKDLEFAKKVSYELNSPLKINLVTINEFEKELPKIISLIESSDPVRVGVASTIYFATKKMSEKVCFSGLGADELFAGYNRFKESNDINKDCYSYFIKMYENDLYFEDIITMNNKTELRVPFLDKEFVQNALVLEPKYKLKKEGNKIVENKLILRRFASELGLPKELAYRPKKAAQYGSNFDKAIDKIARKNGFKSKASYLNSLMEKELNKEGDEKNIFGVKKNIGIAALISTGKDSLYAMRLMQKQGYVIKCLITIDSKNKDSFMFHTPTITLAKLQAKSLDIPFILVKTNGEKESELIDLKKAIKQAQKEYSIEGIVSGALFSNYQRERIETICEDLGLRAFAPLWHMNQAKYMKQIIGEGNKVMITKIACMGLDQSWVGKIIDKTDLTKLDKLAEKYGVNVAGEGGEYETLMIDMPIFSKSLDIKFTKKMENEFTGEIIISKSELIQK
ncbi:MAG: diphthine--ammonia ligase [archaeon]|jgi:asparagine synthase (glutamine-hydrolysing)